MVSHMVEPWLSGTHTEVHPLIRPLLHAFDHALLDLAKWTEGMTMEEIWSRPLGLGPAGFHIRHIAGSTDRLFTYLEGSELSEPQLAALNTEMTLEGSREELLAHLEETLERIRRRAAALDPARLAEPRFVGRKRLPTTVNGLLVHIAEHTMRHVGEAIITAKVVRAAR
jgi:hypothetical protein